METGKHMIQAEGRLARSLDVRIMFTTAEDFNIMDKDGNLKYVGKISGNAVDHNCTCPSFMWNNNERYMAENGKAFECKHIMRAKAILGWKQ